jgi:hypothetical protein
MRRIRIEVSGILPAASEHDAARRVRAALDAAGLQPLACVSEDMGPVECVTLVPDAIVEGQGVA